MSTAASVAIVKYHRAFCRSLSIVTSITAAKYCRVLHLYRVPPRFFLVVEYPAVFVVKYCHVHCCCRVATVSVVIIEIQVHCRLYSSLLLLLTMTSTPRQFYSNDGALYYLDEDLSDPGLVFFRLATAEMLGLVTIKWETIIAQRQLSLRRFAQQ